jgi:hypothetical protein
LQSSGSTSLGPIRNGEGRRGRILVLLFQLAVAPQRLVSDESDPGKTFITNHFCYLVLSSLKLLQKFRRHYMSITSDYLRQIYNTATISHGSVLRTRQCDVTGTRAELIRGQHHRFSCIILHRSHPRQATRLVDFLSVKIFRYQPHLNSPSISYHSLWHSVFFCWLVARRGSLPKTATTAPHTPTST